MIAHTHSRELSDQHSTLSTAEIAVLPLDALIRMPAQH
jgi:hypothetical protein